MIRLKLSIIMAVLILIENQYHLGTDALEDDVFHHNGKNIQELLGQISNKEKSHTPSYSNQRHKRYDTVQSIEQYIIDEARKFETKRHTQGDRISSTESKQWQNNYQNNNWNNEIHIKKQSSFGNSPPSRFYLPSTSLEVPIIPITKIDKKPTLITSIESTANITTTSVKNDSELTNKNQKNPKLKIEENIDVSLMKGNQIPEIQVTERTKTRLYENSTGTSTVDAALNGSQIIAIRPKITTTTDQHGTVLSIEKNANNTSEMKVSDAITEEQVGSGVGIWQNTTGTYIIESFGNGTKVVMILGDQGINQSNGDQTPDLQMGDSTNNEENKQGFVVSIRQNTTGTYIIESFGNGTKVVMILGDQGINHSNGNHTPDLQMADSTNNEENKQGFVVSIRQNSTGTYTVKTFKNGTEVILNSTSEQDVAVQSVGNQLVEKDKNTGKKNNNCIDSDYVGDCNEHNHNTYEHGVHYYHHIIYHHHGDNFPSHHHDCEKHDPKISTSIPCKSNLKQNQHLCKHEFHDYPISYPHYPGYPFYPPIPFSYHH